MLRWIALAASLVLVTSCGAALAEMRRAEESYDQARYEVALSRLTEIENDVATLETPQRSKYFYLRGMTEYRLGHRSEALYYLAVAREIAGEDAVGLRAEQAELMNRTLGELTPTGMTHLPPEASE